MLDLSEETEALARRVAADQRTSVDDAVRRALLQQARSVLSDPGTDDRPVSDEEIARRRALIREVQDAIAVLPILDPRPVEEIFDEINEL